MKLILGLIALCLCTYIGYKLSYKFYLRKIFYKDFFTFNTNLKNNVRFTLDSFNKIIEKFNSNGDFLNLLIKITNEKGDKRFTLKYIDNEENDFIYNYVNSIGKTDRDGQLNYLNYIENEISIRLKKCEEDEKKYKTLYVKLGFLFGLVVLVLLL